MKKHITPLLVLPLVFASACSLDLHSPEIIEETMPGEAGEILDPGESPSIAFSRAMDEASVESAFRITREGGEVPGIWRWENNKAVFEKHGDYRPGKSYLLVALGAATDKRGTSHPLSLSIPFYVEEGASGSVQIVSIDPQGGASLDSPVAPVTLTFSEPMDKSSTEKALRVYPDISFDTLWDSDGRKCTLQPTGSGWAAPSTYTVSIDSSAVSQSGDKRSSYFEAHFYAASEPPPLTAPHITTVLLQWPPPFPETSKDLTSLKENESFRMEFDRIPERGSVEYAFSISPFCAGSLHWTSDTACVFIPDLEESFEPNTEYRIQLTADARSKEGGSLEEPFEHTFTGSVPPPRAVVLDGSSSGSFPVNLPHTSILLFTPEGLLGSCTFIWKFDKEVLTEEERVRLQDTLSLTPVFPPDISYPRAVHFLWTAPDTLVSQFERVGLESDGRTFYYSLNVPTLSPGGENEEAIMLEYSP